MNVMLTCAGRRNYLVRFFQDALRDRGQVFAVDSSIDAPALQEADRAFIVPNVAQSDYFDTLLKICLKHEVGLLISLNDLELPLLSRQRERFLAVDCIPVVSSPEVVDICFDKWETYRFLTRCGIDTPKTFRALEDALEAIANEEIAFPLVVKPRWGSASISIEFPDDVEELELTYRLVRKRLNKTILADVSASDWSVIIQEKLPGQEYGLDVINDLSGNYINTFVKQKRSMRAGETDRAITVDNEPLVDLGSRLARSLGHIGNLDCDVFVCGDRHCVLEMNPRFGGGYPFSHAAGADLPAALVAWADGLKPNPDWLSVRPNVQSSKYDSIVRIADLRKDLSHV